MERKVYTSASVDQFVVAAALLRRAGVDKGVARQHLSPFVVRRCCPVVAHPSGRHGHPLAPIVVALYHSGAFAGEVRAAVDRGAHEGPTGLNIEAAARALLGVFDSMDACDGDSVSMADWASEIALLVEDAPLNVPADWLRLLAFVLQCVPTAAARRALGGFANVHRYRFTDCGHAFEEEDDAAAVQQAHVDKPTDLVAALRDDEATHLIDDVQCAICGVAGPMQHAVGARRLRAGAEPPMLLWVLLVRSAQNAILRHAVKLPRYVALDSITGVISLARCGCVPSSCRCAPPRHRAADGDAAGAHAGTSVAYELYGVMLYHSAEERGDPPPEFEGDSGGRYSICIRLDSKSSRDDFHWIRDVSFAGIRGAHVRRIL